MLDVVLEDEFVTDNYAELSNYVPIRTLGQGRFSTVLLNRFKKTGEHLVIKMMNPAENEYILKCFVREGDIIQKLQHPNIIGFKMQF